MTTTNDSLDSKSIANDINPELPTYTSTSPDIEKERTNLKIIYALYIASLLLGVTQFVAIVMNYIKKDDAKGTFMESHHRWLIRTFWFNLLWMIVGIAGIVVIVGWVVLAASCLWFIYRIVKGYIYLTDGKPMYAE